MAEKFTQNDSIMAVVAHNLDNKFEGHDHLLLSGLVGREGISSLFNYEMRLLSINHNIRPEQLIGTNVTITQRLDVKKDRSQERFIDGFISKFKVMGKIKEFRIYEAEVVPFIWFMTLTSDCRIFQEKTVVDILRETFANHQAFVDFSGVVGNYPKLEYCVQYRETNFDFVSRLMEEYGIFYYFKHEFGRHTVVLADDNLALKKFDPKPIPFKTEKGMENLVITRWQHVYEHRFGRYVHTDFNYENPRNDLTTFRNTRVKIPAANPRERFDYHGRYKELSAGELLARLRMEEEDLRAQTVEGFSNHAGFESGMTFVFDKRDEKRTDDDKKQFVVTAVEATAYESRYTEDNFWEKLLTSLPQLLLDIGKGAGGAVAGSLIEIFKDLSGGFSAGIKQLGTTILGGIKDPLQKWAEDRGSSAFDSMQPGYSNHFFCILDSIPIRPPRVTKRPEIRGPQTAFVIGPVGKEIWTDSLGRVKIKFHWDRYVKVPENATCWIRFAETWAGNNWGTLHPPRIGQEVIVDFLQADPDLPIITGRVYNAVNKPAFELPKYQTRAGIKTRSTPHPTKGGYHMMRFEDQTGKEQLLLRSQRRTDFRTYASYYETTHANRHFLIGYNDPDTDEKGGNAHLTIGGEWNLHIGCGRYDGMDDVYHLRVTGAGINSYEADEALMVKGLCEINARAIHIEAKTKISLKVGGSFITIDPSGIAIKGPIVQINTGGSGAAVGDKCILDPVDASISDNGEPGYLEHLREVAAKSGGGGHRQRHVAAQHGPNVTRNADGSLQFSPGIRVDGSNPDYASAVVQDLITIGDTREGQQLFNNLDSSGRQVTIQPINPAPNPPNAFATPGTGTNQNFADATPAGQPVFDGAGNPLNDAAGTQLVGTGLGTDSTVGYNPGQWPSPASRTQAPGDAILFHELTHSDNQQQGTMDNTPRADNFDTNEEFNTIGPENRYRDERGIPRRNDHHDL